jgi:hypothetical protein
VTGLRSHLPLALAGSALLLSAYAAFGRPSPAPAPAIAAPPTPCACDEASFRRDVAVLTRRLDALAEARAPAATSAPEAPSVVTEAPSGRPGSLPHPEGHPVGVDEVTAGDRGAVVTHRNPDGTVVTSRALAAPAP